MLMWIPLSFAFVFHLWHLIINVPLYFLFSDTIIDPRNLSPSAAVYLRTLSPSVLRVLHFSLESKLRLYQIQGFALLLLMIWIEFCWVLSSEDEQRLLLN